MVYMEKDWMRKYQHLPEEARLAFLWLLNHYDDMKILLRGGQTDAQRIRQICQDLMCEGEYIPAALAALKCAMLQEDGS